MVVLMLLLYLISVCFKSDFLNFVICLFSLSNLDFGLWFLVNCVNLLSNI